MENVIKPSELLQIKLKGEPSSSLVKKESNYKNLDNEFIDYTTMVSVPRSEIDELEGGSAFIDAINGAESAHCSKEMSRNVCTEAVPNSSATMDVDEIGISPPIFFEASINNSTENVSTSTQLKIVEKDKVKDDYIVMVLSDSEEENSTKPKKCATETKNMEESPGLANQVTVEVIAPASAIQSTIDKVDASADITKKNQNDIIMLEDSPYNSEVEMPNVAESLKDNPNETIEYSRSIESAEPLRLMEKLVKDYHLDTDNVTKTVPPTVQVSNPTASQTAGPVKLIESQKKEPILRLVEMDKLLESNVQKHKEKRECINFECKSKKPMSFCLAPLWALSHFNVPKKVNRGQFICDTCFDLCASDYERMCTTLVNHQPLLMEKLPMRPELVEILDSSDEEDNNSCNAKYVDNLKSLSLDTLTLLEDHFEDVVKETLSRVNIDQQISWTNQILNDRLQKNETITDELDVEIKTLQKLADSMYEKLYRITNFVIEDLPPFDLNLNKQLHMYGETYPPEGEVVYTPVDHISLYYAVRAKLLTAWIPCKVTEQVEDADGKKAYKVRFLRTKGVLNKTVPGNYLAYGSAPIVRLDVGTRVIALFTMEPNDHLRSTFFPGIIAEPLQNYNRWRYLIFFDDGYAQYVTPDNIRLICSPSPNCWDDVYPDAAEFIKSYLKQYYSQRAMVQVKRGQKIITECNAEWTHARVHDVDGSLVQMCFEAAKRTEWIYRGSTRLGPLYKDSKQKHSVSSGKRNEPFVEYMSVDSDGKTKRSDVPVHTPVPVIKPSFLKPPIPNVPSTSQAPAPTPTTGERPEEKRSVARKSITALPRPQPAIQHMNNATIYVEEDNRPKGKVVYYTAKKHMPPRKYARHNCGVSCLYEVKHNLSSYSPLAKPLLSGWERKILRNKSKKIVVYRSPCGRTLRNMSELHRYLRATKCSLNVDNFDFDYLIHCLAEYVIDTCIIQKQDLSDGCEPMVVPCVNYYDNTMPPPCVYSAKRVPNEGVNLNLDANFMCGCDCDDDCMDKTKCQCWKLTVEGAQFGNPNSHIDQVGYEFKRLPNPVATGIYECNSRCKCSKICLNRVAQHPLQMKLQVFKTVSRGWGLRCLNDVPKGSFICVYAGDLLTEQNANIAGDNYGDEYFAELDYIEVVESLKEGYEPGVLDDDFDDEEFDIGKAKEDSDDDEYVATVSEGSRQTRYNTRHSVDVSKKKPESSKIKTVQSPGSYSDEEDTQRQLISFVPNANSASFENNSSGRYKSIRKFYGKNESVFIMDAKKLGNIGRYFNHSCSPNLFVQNVFVDTHDLRFPWVAFFALSHIRAGSELTWNYNYDVGSVPGKVMYCECGAENCRGRLL